MFVSKQGMNIDGFGVKQIELFLSLGWITDFASIFRLREYRELMLTLEGYKEKSVTNLLDAIEKSRHTTLDRIFTAIGIPNVGKKTARQLASVCLTEASKKQTSILESLFSVTQEDLLEVKDI